MTKWYRSMTALGILALTVSFSSAAPAEIEEGFINAEAQKIVALAKQIKEASASQKRELLPEACALGNNVGSLSQSTQRKILARVRTMGVKENLVALFRKYCR